MPTNVPSRYMRYTEYTKITSLHKIEHTYCWRGDGKGGEQGTSEDTTEEWQGQGIDRNEVLHRCNRGVWNER